MDAGKIHDDKGDYNMEKTYIMLKPDALRRGLIGEILARIEHKG